MTVAIKEKIKIRDNLEDCQNCETKLTVISQMTLRCDDCGLIKYISREEWEALMANDVKEKQDEMNARSIKTVALDLLSIEVDYLGAIHHDDAIPRSIQEHLPFVGYDPDSMVSRELMDIIAFRILKDEELPTQKVMPKGKENTFKDSWKICSTSCAFWSVCEFRSNGNECELVE